MNARMNFLKCKPHISLVFKTLQWVFITFRLESKFLCMTNKTLHHLVPFYLLATSPAGRSLLPPHISAILTHQEFPKYSGILCLGHVTSVLRIIPFVFILLLIPNLLICPIIRQISSSFISTLRLSLNCLD